MGKIDYNSPAFLNRATEYLKEGEAAFLMDPKYDPFQTAEAEAWKAETYTEDQLFYVYCWDSPRRVRTFHCFTDSSGLLLNAEPRYPVYTGNYKHSTISAKGLTRRQLAIRVQTVTAWGVTAPTARQVTNAKYYLKCKARRMAALLEDIDNA